MQVDIEEVLPGQLLLDCNKDCTSIMLSLDAARDLYRALETFITVGIKCDCGFGFVGIHGETQRCQSCKKEFVANKDFDDLFIRYRNNGDRTRYNVCRICNAEFQQDSNITSLCSKHRR